MKRLVFIALTALLALGFLSSCNSDKGIGTYSTRVSSKVMPTGTSTFAGHQFLTNNKGEILKVETMTEEEWLQSIIDAEVAKKLQKDCPPKAVPCITSKQDSINQEQFVEVERLNDSLRLENAYFRGAHERTNLLIEQGWGPQQNCNDCCEDEPVVIINNNCCSPCPQQPCEPCKEEVRKQDPCEEPSNQNQERRGNSEKLEGGGSSDDCEEGSNQPKEQLVDESQNGEKEELKPTLRRIKPESVRFGARSNGTSFTLNYPNGGIQYDNIRRSESDYHRFVAYKASGSSDMRWHKGLAFSTRNNLSVGPYFGSKQRLNDWFDLNVGLNPMFRAAGVGSNFQFNGNLGVDFKLFDDATFGADVGVLDGVGYYGGSLNVKL